MTYLLHVLIAIDQLANALLGGAADETLSARAWRAESQGKVLGRVLRPLIDTLLWFDKDHCYKAWKAERDRTQIDGSYRA